MQYKITKVLGDYDAQFGSRRYEFNVEGNENKISGFSKYPMTVGQDIEGEITQKGSYYNWSWTKKETNDNGTEKPSAEPITDRASNILSLKVVPLLEESRDLQKEILAFLKKDEPAF